jgi:hypothetical protein
VISKLPFSIQKFYSWNFFQFLVIKNPGFGTGSGSAIRKNAGSGSALNQCGSTTLELDVHVFGVQEVTIPRLPEEKDVQPVGHDYIEEMKSEDGKVVSFNCKLCECRFNDPNAKEMHMKVQQYG